MNVVVNSSCMSVSFSQERTYGFSVQETKECGTISHNLEKERRNKLVLLIVRELEICVNKASRYRMPSGIVGVVVSPA